MSYPYTPERPLNPPEDTRKSVYRCPLCGWDIYEGDDYYYIEPIGYCCVTCIEEAKRYEAELDYPEYEREED